MAVLVQKFVSAEKAGVLFTADPVSGARLRMVIEGVWGSGDSLVSGKQAPERVMLDSSTLQSTEGASPGKKGSEQRRDFESGPAPDSCLDSALVRTLAETAQQLERFMGCPQDIEWAAVGPQIFLLQCRPITALPTSAAAPEEIWTRANACETFPDVVTPLSWSILDTVLVNTARPILEMLGIKQERNWFALLHGRVYISLNVTVDLLGWVREFAIQNLQRIFGGIALDLPTDHIDVGRRLRNLPRRKLALRDLPFQFWLAVGALVPREPSFGSLARGITDELDRRSVASLTDAELAELPEEFVRRFLVRLRSRAEALRMVGALGGGIVCALLFEKLARDWLHDQPGARVMQLLGRAGSMTSAEAGIALVRLALEARRTRTLKGAVLAAGSFAELKHRLQTCPEGQGWLAGWNDFMLHHGHHARGEIDIASARWHEQPDYILSLLRTWVAAAEDFDPLAELARRDQECQKLAESCRRQLRNPIKRVLFSVLLPRARAGLAGRENAKSEFVRVSAFLRRAVQEAGTRLARKELLEKGEHVFYLTWPEVKELLLESRAFDVAQRIKDRRHEMERNRAIEPPMLVVGSSPVQPARADPISANGNELHGVPASPGVATGPARVILHNDGKSRLLPGEILVAPVTDPAWSPYFLSAAGIVVDVGGILSHGSVVAREYGIPAVVNVGSGTRRLRTGQLVRVDGDRGVVTVLDGCESWPER